MSFTNPSEYSIGMLNTSRSNFNNAFTPNRNMIPQRDTKNYGNMIHNNVNQNVLSEIITEYTLHIDGKDRDTSVYPNPFSFSVSLGGMATRIENGQTISGVPNPRIDANFKNVKYVKLKYILLPRNINFDLEEDLSGNKIYTVASSKPEILSHYRYLLLKIKEISNDKLYSTNDVLKNECFVLYRDSRYPEAVNDLWFATQPVKIYYDNGLKNLSKITFEILTPSGVPLRLLNGIDLISYDEINNDLSTESPSSNFFSEFNDESQINLELELGVCENQINSEKNYR